MRHGIELKRPKSLSTLTNFHIKVSIKLKRQRRRRRLLLLLNVLTVFPHNLSLSLSVLLSIFFSISASIWPGRPNQSHGRHHAENQFVRHHIDVDHYLLFSTLNEWAPAQAFGNYYTLFFPFSFLCSHSGLILCLWMVGWVGCVCERNFLWLIHLSGWRTTFVRCHALSAPRVCGMHMPCQPHTAKRWTKIIMKRIGIHSLGLHKKTQSQ